MTQSHTMPKTGRANGASQANGKTSEERMTTPSNQAVTQKFGTVRPIPLGLEEKSRAASVEALNQILADTITLTSLYKKHHWQVSGSDFYQLHLLFDKHYEEQSALVDEIAERIQLLGGVAVAMSHDVAELTTIPRPPRDREEPRTQIARILEAHEILMKEVRTAAKEASDAGDEGTNDLLISDVLRTNEMQTWFVSEHVQQPSIYADEH